MALWSSSSMDQFKQEGKVYWKEYCYVCHGPLEVDFCFDVNALLPDTQISVGSIVQQILKPSLASWERIQKQYLCNLCLQRFHEYKIAEEKLAKLRAQFHYTYKVCCQYYTDEYIENGFIHTGCQTEELFDDLAHGKKDPPMGVEDIGCQTDETELAYDIPLEDDIPLSIKQEDDIDAIQTRRTRKSKSKVKTKVEQKGKKVEASDEVATESSDVEEEGEDIDFVDYDEIGKLEPDSSPAEKSPVKVKKKYKRKKYSCEYCPRVLRRPGELKNHMLVTHMDRNPNHCSMCGRKFNSRNGLYVHLKKIHHVDYAERMALVSPLEEGMDLKDFNVSRDDQEKSPHNSEIEEDGDIEERDADSSDSDWTEEGGKAKRARPSRSASSRKKENLASDGEVKTAPNRANSQRSKKKVVTVKYLNEKGFGDEEFTKEEKEETGREKIEKKKKKRKTRVGERFTLPLIHECSTCGKKWRTKSELNAHIQTHSDLRPWVCEICGQGYKLRKALLVHVGMHKGVHPFICNYCNKSFTQKIGLVKHMNIHENVKKYTCDVCGKSFIHQTSYSAHKLVHTGERPAKCSVCGLALTSVGHLNTHMLCDLCGKSFIHSSSYTFHKLVHTGERLAKCSLCDVALVSKSHLNRHMLVHTGEKPHECSVCGKRFAKKWNRDVHLKKLHGLEPSSTTSAVIGDPSEGPIIDIRNSGIPIEKIGLVGSSTAVPQIPPDVNKRKANEIATNSEPTPFESIYLQY